MIEFRAGGRRILRGVRDPFDLTIFVDGKETDADAPPSVTVTRGLGAAVATGATSTKPTDTTGLYRWTPAAPDVASVERYTATWTVVLATVTHTVRTSHEVVGGFYVDLAELRMRGGLEEVGFYPDERLVEARRGFEDLFEEQIHQAWVPRYGLTSFLGDGGVATVITDTPPFTAVLGVTIDGVAQDPSDYTIESYGLVESSASAFTAGQRCQIAYEHGYAGVTGDIREAALTAIVARVLGDTGSIPERAISFQSEVGNFGLSIAGPDRPTGIPTVDAVIARYRTGEVLLG